MTPAILAIIESFRSLYGNERWTCGPGFLLAAAQGAVALDPGLSCVECGSGLSTRVLRHILGDRLVSLEHDEEHAARTGALIAPIRSFGDYAWYDTNGHMPERVGLVVCDGPPAICPGGRYGAMPRLADRLVPGFALLLDDVNREEEKAVLKRWCREYGPLSIGIGREPDGRAFAVVRRAA